MSKPENQTVTCPKCGETIAFTLWHSINTDMPDAIPNIISGKLFEAACKKCGYKTHVNYPLLFNDMLHQVMIYNAVPENVKEAEDALNSMKTLYPGRTRIVLGDFEADCHGSAAGAAGREKAHGCVLHSR